VDAFARNVPEGLPVEDEHSPATALRERNG
jgi:hypothetical protein